MDSLDTIFEKLTERPLYISIKEAGKKKHEPYNFRTGYTNLLGATLFKLDQLESLKGLITESVNQSELLQSMQITDRTTRKVLFKYSKN